MSVWKIATGVVVGVGAVAAAPFTGGGSVLGAVSLLGSLAGAGTIATAVGAGLVGGAVGAAMDDDDEIHDKGHSEGYKKGKSESAAEIERLAQKLKDARRILQMNGTHLKAIIALEAVATAVAHCAGPICDDKRRNIDAFILGESLSVLPVDIKSRIDTLYKYPLSVSEAYKTAKDSGLEMSLFRDIINFVAIYDSTGARNTEAFKQAWNNLAA